METVRVACVQYGPVVGDGPGNRRRARDAVREAVSAGARLVILPELCTSGYVFESAEEARSLAQPPDGPALRDWAEEAAATDAVVVGGFAELADDGTLYNSAAVVDPTGTIAVYRKLHLWDRERLFFEPGATCAQVLDTRVGRVGVEVCYDLYFPEVARGLALGGAEIIVLPTNSPLLTLPPPGERRMEVLVAMTTAHVNRVFFAVCDRTGAERGVEWVGGSVIADPDGWLAAGPPPEYGPGLVIADCDLAKARDKSWNERNDVFGDRRPDLYTFAETAAAR